MNEHDHSYYSAQDVRKQYNVSATTLRRWAAAGRLGVVRAPGGNRMYSASDLRLLFAGREEAEARARVCYARVSSAHQRADLERQVADLRAAYPDHEVITDVGSGLNWHRPGFKALLDRVHGGTVQEVVVTHRDRLCRFAGELVDWVFEKGRCRLVVLGHSPNAAATDELRDDLLAIVTVFVARNNGLRAADNRRHRRALAAAAADGHRHTDPSSGDEDEDSAAGGDA